MVRKLYVLMDDRIVMKCFCFPVISMLNGEMDEWADELPVVIFSIF